MSEKKKKKITTPEGELMMALDITADDLQANHDGIITAHQKATVLQRNRSQWRGLQIASIILTIVGIGPVVMIWQAPDELIGSITLAGIFLGLGALFGLMHYGARKSVQTDLDTNILETTQGVAVVNLREDTVSDLEINGITLNAPKDVLKRIRHLERYVIHYLPKSKIILSMEHIPDDDNLRRDTATSRLQDSDDTMMTDYVEPDDLSQSASG